MNRVTFSLIFLLLLINSVHCKKYLVEVEDKNGDNAKENQESNKETLEDNTTTEPEGKYTFPNVLCMIINIVKKSVKRWAAVKGKILLRNYWTK